MITPGMFRTADMMEILTSYWATSLLRQSESACKEDQTGQQTITLAPDDENFQCHRKHEKLA